MLGITRPLPAADPRHQAALSGQDIVWGPAPSSLPPGAQGFALVGSPAEAGPLVLRLKLPAGFLIPPHWHFRDGLVTVIAGGLAVAAGERVDPSTPVLRPGGSLRLPGGMAHFAFTTEETVVEIAGTGPFHAVYIDPDDDPRRSMP
jgi:hypothetical protein